MLCSEGIQVQLKYKLETFYREPTRDGIPVSGFLPIQGDKINFLDITNDGLKPGVNPNPEAYELWANIERKITN